MEFDNGELPKQINSTIEETPLNRWRKIIAVTKDPDAQAFAAASYRTAMNAILTAADIPAIHFIGVGETASFAADGLKLIRSWIAKTGYDPRFLDLTPDIKKRYALGSEAFELVTCFHAPTHGIEAGMQFWYFDRHTIKKGVEEIKRIWALETVEQLEFLQAEKLPALPPKKESFFPEGIDERELLPYIPSPLPFP